MKRTLQILVIAIIVIVMAGCNLFLISRAEDNIPKDAITEQAEKILNIPPTHTVTFALPDSDPITVQAEAGSVLSFPEAPHIDGYTFIGWKDAQGRTQSENTFILTDDTAFSANYQIAFKDQSKSGLHEPYMSLDENNLFHPEDALLRGEAIEIIHALLDTDKIGSGTFIDIEADNSCYAAAATLKDIRVIAGSRFHPNDPITFAELFEILVQFYPASKGECEFSYIPVASSRYGVFCTAFHHGWFKDPGIDPDADITRRAAVRIFAQISGRNHIEETDHVKVGTICDVSNEDPDFWTIADAVIPHNCSFYEIGEYVGEYWSDSKPVEVRDPGFFFIGTALHCIDDSGSPAINRFVGNIQFGSDGAYTTGMPELDELVHERLDELVRPEIMSCEEMLRTLYDHVVYSYPYLRSYFLEMGATDWENEMAYKMFTEGKGNCYCYAGAFTVLARAVGYDAVCYSGTIGIGSQPHGWVEIEFDGVPYVFDPNIEYEEHVFHGNLTCMYMLSPDRYAGWNYIKSA